MIIFENMNPREINTFILKDRISEADNIITLKFSPVKGKIFQFTPGQFVSIFFLDDRVSNQGKPYSISSIPADDFLGITVKKIGKFSGALHDLRIGEKVKIESPQGYFYPENQMKNIVFLAGGIGITPFYSVIKDYFNKRADKNIFLFYSNNTKDETAFLNELSSIAKNWEKFKIVYFFTRENAAISTVKNKEFKRIDVELLKKYLKNLDKKYYFICGPVGFVTDLWKELKRNNIKDEYIKVESFY